MIVQMPILSGMFYALQSFKYLSHPGFLCVFLIYLQYIIFIFCRYLVLTTYFSSRQSSLGAANSNPGGKAMLFVMPLFIGFMTLRFPAGLGLLDCQ